MGVFMLQVLSTREFVLGSNCELLRIFCSRLCVTLIALAVEKSRQWSLLDQLAGSCSKELCRLCRKASLTGALPFVELFARSRE